MNRMREMINSGIDWIRTIPFGWQVMPYKRAFKEIERLPLDDDEIITCFRDGEVTLRKNRREDGFTIAEQESGYQHIAKGDLVVHGMDGFAGSIGISDSDGKATPVLIVLNPLHDECSKYFMYQLRVYSNLEVFLATATGIRVRSCSLNWKKLGNLPAIVPPPDEQQRIADYLDERCDAIDEAKRIVEKEINSLQRLRKATIFRAVTKGLDIDSNMRDSGIQWVGKIPFNWEIGRIGGLYKHRNVKVNDSDYQPLSVTKKGILPQLETATKSNDHDNRKLVEVGDFVINSRSDRRGSCGISHFNGSVSLINTVLEPCGLMSPAYYGYLFRTSEFADEFYKCGHGIVDDLWTTRWQDMKSMKVPCPPIEMQIAIADYLDGHCAAIDSIISTRSRQLDRLEDYRKAIIYAYVTGKKEVPTL